MKNGKYQTFLLDLINHFGQEDFTTKDVRSIPRYAKTPTKNLSNMLWHFTNKDLVSATKNGSFNIYNILPKTVEDHGEEASKTKKPKRRVQAKPHAKRARNGMRSTPATEFFQKVRFIVNDDDAYIKWLESQLLEGDEEAAVDKARSVLCAALHLHT